MTGFDFGFTASASQPNIHKTLDGNKIHDVTFDGCEARDIKGVQDPTKTFKVIDIKFSNADGQFIDTIFEPTESDFEDTTTPYLTPSRVKQMMLKIKHLIDAVNPTLAAQIDKKEKSLTASNWDGLRQLIVKATDPGKGTTTKIKLLVNSKGAAAFPSFFAAYNKENQLYMRTNFIGNNIFFTSKELERMNAAKTAKPTSVGDFTTDNTDSKSEDVDWTF